MSASHRVALAGGWSAWRWVMVRAAGFPADTVLRLASPVLAAAIEDRDPESAELREVFSSERGRISRELREIARDPRFREALTWQNRSVLRDAVDRLLASELVLNRKSRRRERVVAAYCQRYCTKNDTIGFFGPIGWGVLSAERPFTVRPGPSLLAARDVYFEAWAIDALAAAIADDDEVKPLLAPRRLPGVRIEDGRLHYGLDKSTEMAPAVASLLERSDGSRPAAAVAAELIADERTDIDEPEEVYELLEQLVDAGLATWEIELPVSIPRPENELRRLLEALADRPIRERAIARLDRLEAARAEVAASAGDPGRLGDSLAALEETFVELTGEAGSRRAGETYGGRSLIYEDCLRDLEVVVGQSITRRLAGVMPLVLGSARWFTAEIAGRIRAALDDVYRALGGGQLSYAAFWSRASALFTGGNRERESGIVADVAVELRRRWGAAIGDATGRRVERTAGEVAGAVREQMAADAPGWPSARHCSPDVMIAAADAAAIERDEFTLVLGEVHLGNTLLSYAAMQQDPELASTMRDALAADLPAPRVSPVDAKQGASRADNVAWSPHDLQVELGPSVSFRSREQVLRLEDLFVERRDRQLTVVCRRSGFAADIIAFVEQYLTFAASSAFRPAPPSSEHAPRITIDGLVLSRERWVFDVGELPFVSAKTDLQQALGACGWARDQQIPRWVFAKIAGETKPIFVDMASPPLVEFLISQLRGAASVVFTEMLPSFDDTWLPDAAGQTYVSELRIAMVDPVRWSGEVG